MIRLAAVLVVLAGPVAAQAICIPREDAIRLIEVDRGQVLQAVALGGNGAAIGIYANLRTGTWSLTARLPNGPTCFVAASIGYERVRQPDE